MRIIIYSKIVNRVSGVQTFEKIFCKQMSKLHDITYVYEAGDMDYISEIGKYAIIIKNVNQELEADICIFSSVYQGPNRIKAKKYIQICHADYRAWGVKHNKNNIDQYVAVSEAMAHMLKNDFNIESIVIPNLLDEVNNEKVLRLVTMSRIAKGKGFERIVDFAKKLRLSGKKFIWEIYGSGSYTYMNKLKYELSYIPQVVFMGEVQGSHGYMKGSDYLVQLSDNEGFCYSVYEALQMQIPVIVTNWAGVEKVVTDSENGYILNMDLSNLDIEKLYNNIPICDKLVVNNSLQNWESLFKLLLN